MRFLRQSLTGLVLLALTLGLLGYAGSIIVRAQQERANAETRAPTARERVFSVRVTHAQKQRITPRLEAFGQLQSARTLELRAGIGGRVEFISERFVEGGQVQQGEVLLRIDPTDAQIAVDRAKADLSAAQGELREAQRAFELAGDEVLAAQDQLRLRERAQARQADLVARGVGTEALSEAAELQTASARQSLLSRRQAQSQAEARIDQAQTAQARVATLLRDAERGLEETVVIAPFTGTLSDADVVPGRLVSANEQLARLLDPDRLDVSFRLSTAQYVRLLDGRGQLILAPVTAHLDVAGTPIAAPGQITRVSASSGQSQSGRQLFARLARPMGLKPGDFVTLSIEEPSLDDVVLLPGSALGADGTVLAIGADNRLEALPVELLRRQGNEIIVTGEAIWGRDIVQARSPVLGVGIAVQTLTDERGVSNAGQDEMVELSDRERERLIALVEASAALPAAQKTRLIDKLNEAKISAAEVERLKARLGAS